MGNFFDSGAGYEETRIIVVINRSVEFSRFVADTRMLDSTGKRIPASRPRADDYYGLSPSELPEIRCMKSKMTQNTFEPSKT